MKHLLTAIACCLAVAGSAQTPYNPDGNADGMIGSSDLVTLLSFYGALFESDSLSVVSVDELTEQQALLSNGDSVTVYLVPNEIDVVLNDPDSCYYYYLQLESGAPRSILVQSQGSPYVWHNDSLIVGGCDSFSPSIGVLNQFIRINGNIYPIW